MLKNDYMTIAEASEKWGISQRQVQHLCTLGSVEGAVKFGRAWMIPMNASKPIDGRTKEKQLKHWTRAKKNALVETKNQNWDDWSEALF